MVSRVEVEVGRRGASRLWRELFGLMARVAQRPAAYFSLPADDAIEIGQIVRL